MTDIVITGAVRTPIGAFNGALSTMAASDLGAVVIKEAMKRAGVAPEEPTEVIMGQVLTAGQGQNPARQAAINAGLPASVPAYGINHLCGSGLRSIILGQMSIGQGEGDIIVAGGQENMSLAPLCGALWNGR